MHATLLSTLLLAFQTPGTVDASGDLLLRVLEPATGDLPELVERRLVRVLVPYGHTTFFVDKGKPRGITYEILQRYETFLNEAMGKPRLPINVAFVPVAFDEILPSLAAGYGDIGAATMTITPERARICDFADPLADGIDQVVVTGKGARPLASLDDLSGRTVYVASGTSYAASLNRVSAELVARGLAPIDVATVERQLATEDVLEMANAGIIETTVADRWLADHWARVLDGIRVHEELAVDRGGQIAWAIRKQSPELMASLNAFAAEARQGTLLGNVILKRYLDDTRWIENPVADAERARLERWAELFRAAGDEYGFDWLLLAAQAYQESGLNPDAVSRSGAIGILQFLPATAADMDCDDPSDPEQAIHAGARYLAWVRGRVAGDSEISPAAQIDLALAGYNAGPTRVKNWRKAAAERGLDPNAWFGNVEVIAREEVGMETVRYVSNINKYYVAYRLAFDLTRAREAVPASAPSPR